MIRNIQRKQRDCISTTAKTRFSMGNIDAKSSLSFFFRKYEEQVALAASQDNHS